jgi:hypothetical protein
MTRPRRLLPLLIGSLLLASGLCRAAEPPAPAGTSLGRLFLTPEWRTALERQRQMNIQQAHSLAGDTLRLDGVVVRSSGKSTVWSNNRPQNEGTRDSGVTAVTSQRQPGRATVATGAESPVNLKVGVTLNQATQEKSGGLAGGEIRVRPAPRQ